MKKNIPDKMNIGTYEAVYIVSPNRTAEARERGQILAAEVREALKDSLDGSLEETMWTLRGRSLG